jgi:hypothetical protein
MENNMTSKITAALVAAAVLASAGIASAQPKRFGPQPQAPYADSVSNNNIHWVPAGPDTLKESNPYSWAHI